MKRKEDKENLVVLTPNPGKTICSYCGEDLTSSEIETDRFIRCSRCGRFTPKGATSYLKQLKGGNVHMVDKAKKEKVPAKAKAPKVEKAQKEPSKRTEVGEKAEAMKKWFTDNNIDKVFARKIISRVYTEYSDEINKKK